MEALQLKMKKSNERVKYHYFATSNDFVDVGTDNQRQSCSTYLLTEGQNIMLEKKLNETLDPIIIYRIYIVQRNMLNGISGMQSVNVNSEKIYTTTNIALSTIKTT